MSIISLPLYPTAFGGMLPEMSTDVGVYDAAYVPHALKVNLVRAGYARNTPYGFSLTHPEVSGEYWLHFRMSVPSNWPAPTSNTDGDWIKLKAPDGTLLGGLVLVDGYVRAQAQKYKDQSGPAMSTGQYEFIPGAIISVDLRLVFGTGITVEFYVNGGLVLSAAAAAGNITATSVSLTDFPHYQVLYIANSSTTYHPLYYSEMVIAQGEPTLGWRIAAMEVTTTGNYADWQGDPAVMSDNDLSTLMLTGTAGQRVSFVPSTYNGPASPATVRGVFSMSTLTTGSGGPQNVAPFLRIGGVDYDNAQTAVGVQTTVVGSYDTNPATGLDWTTADLATFEFGLLSAA